MQPIKYDIDKVPVFSTRQIEDYGDPGYYGYWNYVVIEDSNNIETNYSYNFIKEYDHRKIYLYDRRLRFFNTIRYLIGEGNVPEYIIDLVQIELKGNKNLWNQVRSILKKYNHRNYYNRIPKIIEECIGIESFNKKLLYQEIIKIMDDYDQIFYRFNNTKLKIKRIYFPNMRFICLKLLEKYNLNPMYYIPLTRTKRKRKELESIWNKLFIQ